ncbi:MAG TPA: TolC family protein, partial [Flavobacterium sp.]|uniref:TolC family protein n=1 Tax=Flavobacterium sp. TaxID=239 RepID=UPI002C35AEB1
MKINKIVLLTFMLLVFTKNQAQQKKLMTLKEAVEMAVTNSDAASLARAKVETSKLELDVTKNNQYPNVKASGQYLRLSSANVDSHIQSNNDGGSGSGSSAPLKVDQLMLGQVSVNMPLFNGFKLKNSINESESMYKA